jgi:hypothetical protein
MANRDYPGIPVVTDDARSHTPALKAVKEGLEIAQRRAANKVGASFVTVTELTNAGLIEMINGEVSGVVDGGGP